MTHNPSLYQINTRVFLSELSSALGHPASLDDIPDSALDQLAASFDWVWFLGVWQTGPASRRISREHRALQNEFRHVLPDYTEEDVCGSCFAISRNEVHSDFGGTVALTRLRRRLNERGVKLMLDFVPNHTALDHPWVSEHPNFYIQGSEEKLRLEPQNYIRLVTDVPTILAHGRDPYFDGWSDTLQLNYSEPELQTAMRLEVVKLATLCDGVRCDMAMLILPDVFERTWGVRPAAFWPGAIKCAREVNPNFLLLAEVYWDLEWTLQQEGFDYTYDKRLYDRLRDRNARAVRDHFRAEISYQNKSARFLENHDEPRAASVFSPDQHKAAAVITYCCPGLRFFHDGQFEGRRNRVPVHLRRRKCESVDVNIRAFYERLLLCLGSDVLREGNWKLLDCRPAWEGNWTNDCFLCFVWEKPEKDRLLVVVNYAAQRSQCYLPIPFDDYRSKSLLLRDLLSYASYMRDGSEVRYRGLYLDLPEWGYHLFRITVDQ